MRVPHTAHTAPCGLVSSGLKEVNKKRLPPQTGQVNLITRIMSPYLRA